jgi:hypothetical protein
MAKAKVTHDWNLTSTLCCFVVNPHLPRNKQIHPSDIHPFAKKRKPIVIPYNPKDWQALKMKIKGG